MITKEDITRLANLHDDKGILSAYIRIDPKLGYDRDQASASFKSALSAARQTADDCTAEVLDREKDRVLDFLKDWRPHGKGLAVFSSERAEVWEVFELSTLVPSWVTVDPDPHTAYLAKALDEQPRVCVVMLDGGDGRIYLGDQEAAVSVGKVREDLPSRHDQGGWSQARYQRHVEFHHKQILSEVAEIVHKAFYEQGFDRLVLVGVDEATKAFAASLADPIRSRIVGHLHTDYKQESDEQILQRVSELIDEDERSSELALVDEVIAFAASGGKGVAGIDATIAAVIEGQVDVLVVAEDVTAAGSRCRNCDYFAAREFATCPSCSNDDCEGISDAVEHAIERALTSGSQVNIVSGAAAEMLVPRGGIGALLRYAPPGSA